MSQSSTSPSEQFNSEQFVVSWKIISSSETHAGYGSHNWFSANCKSINSRSQISDGMTPDNWFPYKYKLFKFVKLLISEGIGPVSWLTPKYKIIKLINCPISGGI